MVSEELYIVLFLHQTTTISQMVQNIKGCISYYSYIKPQLLGWFPRYVEVVYRTIPTSNHNYRGDQSEDQFVVYRTIPTSNHNNAGSFTDKGSLYIVLFLHQTTTLCFI